MADRVFIRLKPINHRRRHVLRRYTHSGSGTRFLENRGWYTVPKGLSEVLATARQIHDDPTSPAAFDMADDEAGCKAIEAEYKRLEEEARRLSGGAGGETKQEYAEDDLRQGWDKSRGKSSREQERAGALTTDDLPGNQRDPDPIPDDDPPEDKTKELGVTMSNTKAELLEAADSLGLDVDGDSTKADILEAIDGAVGG